MERFMSLVGWTWLSTVGCRLAASCKVKYPIQLLYTWEYALMETDEDGCKQPQTALLRIPQALEWGVLKTTKYYAQKSHDTLSHVAAWH